MRRLDALEQAIVRAWSRVAVRGELATVEQVAAEMARDKHHPIIVSPHDVAGRLAVLTAAGQIPPQEAGVA